MQQFTITEMERLSGIKSHTLRIWEQRYGIIQPERKESQHRIYSNNDLKDLLRVVHLYTKGQRISAIAKLGMQGIREKIAAEIETGIFYQEVIDQLLDACKNFDEAQFYLLLSRLKIELGIVAALEKVIYPLLEKIGMMWMTDNLIPGQEHFASNLIRQLLITEINLLPAAKDPVRSRVLLFTPLAEYHELALLYMQYQLKSNDIGVVNLGANLPLGVLDAIVAKRRVEVLHFHLITNLGNPSAMEYLLNLCNRFPAKTIVMSGRETLRLTGELPKNVILISAPEQFTDYINNKLLSNRRGI